MKSRLLRQAGYEVKEAATDYETLEVVRQERPSLVLLYVHLPDTSGLEVCRSIKSDPMLASTMILQISASYISSQDRVRGLEGGADSHVTEPVEPDELIAQVKALLPGEVLASGELTWVIDVSQLHPQRAEAAVQSGLQVGFGFPLWAGHEIVAVLEFYTVWWSPEVYPLYGVEPESFTPTLEVDTAPGQGTRIILRY